jgi:hypothetical protein
MISEMFEEIKSLIASVDKKIEVRIGIQKSSDTITPLQIPDEEREHSTLEKSIRQIPLYLTGIQKVLNQNSETIREAEKHVLSHLEELQRKIDNSKTDTSIHHYHVIDIKSSKLMVTFIVLFFLLLGSLIGNIYHIGEVNRMNDNDIKYRYIKSTNGISPENIYKLENIFNYNRDKKMINKIRNEVEEYERKVMETAEKIERERIMDAKTK